MKKFLLVLLLLSTAASAEKIGEVSTEFILFGPNHKIVVDAYDDPKVEGVSCFISHPQKGGIKGAIGLAEETSDASISCRQISEIKIKESLPKQEEAFSIRTSIFFKKQRIIRMVDSKRNVLIYLTYTYIFKLNC